MSTTENVTHTSTPLDVTERALLAPPLVVPYTTDELIATHYKRLKLPRQMSFARNGVLAFNRISEVLGSRVFTAHPDHVIARVKKIGIPGHKDSTIAFYCGIFRTCAFILRPEFAPEGWYRQTFRSRRSKQEIEANEGHASSADERRLERNAKKLAYYHANKAKLKRARLAREARAMVRARMAPPPPIEPTPNGVRPELVISMTASGMIEIHAKGSIKDVKKLLDSIGT